MTRRRAPCGLSVDKGTYKLSASPEDSSEGKPHSFVEGGATAIKAAHGLFCLGRCRESKCRFFEEIYSKIWIIALEMIFKHKIIKYLTAHRYVEYIKRGKNVF